MLDQNLGLQKGIKHPPTFSSRATVSRTFMASSFPFISHHRHSVNKSKENYNPIRNKQLHSVEEEMTVIDRRWIHGVKRKLLRFHRRSRTGRGSSRTKTRKSIVQTPRTGKVKRLEEEEEEEEEEYGDVKEMRWALQQTVDLLSREEMAAVRIQACFRGHLARRAFRALKGLVRLQAVFRGYRVRQQAPIALRCMSSLAKLQVRIRNRQQLAGPSNPTEILPP